MTGMYLEHYGVKGMRWGVRKEDEKRNAFSKNRKPNESNESKYSTNTYHTYPHPAMEKLYTTIEDSAQQRMKKKLNKLNKEAASFFGNPNANQLTPEQRDALWKEAYEETIANEGKLLTDEQKVLLAAYYTLVNAGLDEYFDVASRTENGKLKIVFKHRRSGKVFDTLLSARAYQNTAGTKTREKNVKGEPVAIKVNKDKSLKDILEKTKTENMVKNAMQSIGKTLMSKAKR